jgi:signal transduction histidine kinase
MTEQLLTLSREEAGVAKSKCEPVMLSEMISEVVEVMQPLATGRGLALTSCGDGDIAVQGDPHRLRQVLYNLLDNAIKNTRPGGRIQIALERGPSDAVIAVSDSGVGISAEDLPRVFDRFFRAGHGTPSEGGGSGLGLSIVKSIVNAHGGRVEIDSEVSQGTLVRVHLPTAIDSKLTALGASIH